MKLQLLDPGLRTRAGHNAAMLEEFDLELRSTPRVRLMAAGSAALRAPQFKGLGCMPRPLFRIDGYWRPSPQDVLDEVRLEGLVATIVADLERLPLEELDGVLMPTAYPLHLIALARVARRLASARLMLGFLMPTRFWVPDADADAVLGAHLGRAVLELQQSCELMVYSETGHYEFGGVRADMATLLPPVATSTLKLIEQLAARPARQTDRCVFGFFGQPFTSKGLDVVANAARVLDPGRATLRFRLPPGHDALCERLRGVSAAIDATSRETSNREYLREMADVDVVLTYYDPEHYGSKMSGVVPEALSLGKPVAIAEGCQALIGFLDRYAPGAFVSGSYRADDLVALLSLPAATWQAVGAKAQASSAVVRALKCMRRYLGAGGFAAAQRARHDAPAAEPVS